jgi:glycolate oxidase FAD binding subunit
VTAEGTATVLQPTDLAEARDALRDTAGTVLIRGAGTKADWGARVAPPDVVIDTTALAALVRHDPGDMTATVQAGLPLATLQAALAAHGQWLAVDAPGAAAGATVGGVVAAAEAGPRRLRYGAPRDLVIGATAVLADGTMARSGGTVIKNVAGYDLTKLLCGSLGTLALLADVTVRLHPVEPASRTLRIAAQPDAATTLALDIAAAPLAPAAVDLLGDHLLVRLAGRPEGIAAQAEAVRGLATALGLEADDVDDDAEASAWADVAVALAGAPGETVARAATAPDRLGRVATALAVSADEAGVAATLHSHAALGLHTARLAGGDGRGHAATVAAWRRRVAAEGGTVVVRRRTPAAEDAGLDDWGPDPSAVTLMRAVKDRLDPQGRLAPGRMGWA